MGITFTWVERLDAAFAVLNLPAPSVSEEAWQRMAISSAYYAAFISVRNVLRDKQGLAIPTADAHWFVITTLKQSRRRVLRRIGADLDDLRRTRNQADYMDVVQNLDTKTLHILNTARRIIDRLDQV